ANRFRLTSMTLRTIGVACLLLSSAATGYAQNPSFGMTVHWLDTDEKWIPVQRLGTGWVRFGQAWAAIQPTDADHFDWYVVDTFMAKAKRRGMSVLLDLGDTPFWAKANPSCALQQRCQPNLTAWRNFVAAAIDRYTGAASSSQSFWLGRNIA